ncbi:hypothetical protein OIU84_025541 [Salix udensis]|uniref:Uncharacterized protein n=1 Tax=Salix udensis TaxID=889485 RepID=A0AAD6KJS1_9ROSI|nr:hypothetical protein OIU84_025541 [Salix udensis]
MERDELDLHRESYGPVQDHMMDTSTISEPSSLFFFGWAGSILGPSFAPSNFKAKAQFRALAAAAISVLLLRKQYRLQAPTLIFAAMADRGAGGERGALPLGSAAQVENAEDEVVAAVLAVMRREKWIPVT